jgi:hypothetical protein
VSARAKMPSFARRRMDIAESPCNGARRLANEWIGIVASVASASRVTNSWLVCSRPKMRSLIASWDSYAK